MAEATRVAEATLSRAAEQANQALRDLKASDPHVDVEAQMLADIQQARGADEECVRIRAAHDVSGVRDSFRVAQWSCTLELIDHAFRPRVVADFRF